MIGDYKLNYYHWPQCPFCQRVTLTLYEKGIPHNEIIVRLFKYENYEPEFIKKNPACLVPLVEDHTTFINESDRIIDFLENKFPDTARLYPPKLEKEEWTDVEKFKELISNLPSLMYACMASPEYQKNVKLDPDFVQKSLTVLKNKPEHIRKMAVAHPEFKEIYEKKAKAVESLNVDKMVTELDSNLEKVKQGMHEFESQLINMQQKGKSWLCTDFYSVADVYLTIALHRLDLLGLADILWGDLPNLNAYFHKVMAKPAVKRMIPQYKLGVAGTD